MSEPQTNVPRELCPYCGIDALAGPYAHAKREDCIRAMKERHEQYRRRVSRFVMDNLEEVTNQIGGVTGYRMHLNAIETEKFCREIEK